MSYPTDDYLVTDHDPWLPNLTKAPTIVSVQSGNWSSSSTWDLGRAPQAGDTVGIDSAHTVTYEAASPVNLRGLGVAGTFAWETSTSRQLKLQHFFVYEGGSFQIASEGTPLGSGVIAEIIFRDVAIDTDEDPAQYGNGIIVFGEWKLFGQVKTAFRRLTDSVDANDASVVLESSVSNWEIGDEVVIPESRQYSTGGAQIFSNVSHHWDARTIDDLTGTTLTFDSAVSYDHPAARDEDGTLLKAPHIGNLTRNIIFRSEDGTGTRGHSMFLHRADVDLRYVRFTQMGRTSNENLDSTTFDVDGNPTHIGTQQKGRYALHGHHCMGPVGGQANGLILPGPDSATAFTHIGLVIDDPLPAAPSNVCPASKWGHTIHDSSYGYIQHCIVHHMAGANFVTEDFSEKENWYNQCLSMNCVGDKSERNGTANNTPEDDARAGTGFFFNGFLNRVTSCVAAGNVCTFQEIVSGTGFYGFSTAAGAVRNVPNFVGADPDVDGTSYNSRDHALVEFSDNEAYGGSAAGMTIWNLGTDGYTVQTPGIAESVINNFTVWHTYEEAWFGYPTNRLTFTNFTCIGDGSVSAGSSEAAFGPSWGDYQSCDSTFNNLTVIGMRYGIAGNLQPRGTFTVNGATLNCILYDIRIDTPATPGTAATLVDHNFVFNDVLCQQYGSDPGFLKAKMNYDTSRGHTNLRVLDKVVFNNFDGASGDNFRLYYEEQASDFVMPQSDTDPGVLLTACPDAGLTNAEAYVTYHSDGTAKSPTGSITDSEGCAIGGAVAPDSATTRSGILGLIASSSRIPGPRLLFLKA